MNSAQLDIVLNVQTTLWPEIKPREKAVYSLAQYQAAEKAVFEYYDKTCFHGVNCQGCERDIEVEKIIAETYGIKDFAAFEELLLSPF